MSTEEMGIEDEINKSFPVTPGGQLTLDSDIGNVEIKTGNSDTINVEIKRRFKVDNRQAADELLRNLTVDISQSGDDVKVIVKLVDDNNLTNRRKIQMDFRVSMPRNFNLKLRTVGTANIGNVQGTVTASTAAGSLIIGDVNGPVMATSGGGSLTIGNVGGDLHACSGGGGLSIGNVGGDLHARSGGGSLSIGNVGGDLDARSGGGSLTIGNVGGDLDARSGGGSIIVGRINGRVTASAAGGSVLIEEAIDANEVTAAGGSIKVYISGQPSAGFNMRADAGNIDLRLPDSVAVSVDASCIAGRITTNYDIAVMAGVYGSSLKGDINGGGPSVVLRATAGNIHLHKAGS
jgi:hypothetical protein